MNKSNSYFIGRACACLLVSFALLIAGPTTLLAQQAVFSGVVHDPSGAAVPKASLTLEETDTKRRTTVVASADGGFSFPTVSPGVYTLTVESTGFETNIIHGLTFNVGAKATREITLAIGATTQSVNVNGREQELNTVDASVSTAVDRQFVANLPLNGRSFQSLLTLVPGVTQVISYAGTNYSGEISVNGQRTESNYFTVDGVSVNIGAGHAYASTPGRGAGFAGLTPGVTALGTTQSIVSIDALQEFRATTSTYSAEYGRTPGGQFSFVTRSGTNDWHGSAFDYVRNGVFDANNWFNNQAGIERSAERQNDFGGTLGGPVVIPGLYHGRNQTFFFGSYEGLRLRIPQAAATFTAPSIAVRQRAAASLQPYLNAFPIPNGPDQGNGTAFFTDASTNPASLDSGAIRVDQNVGNSLHLFGRYNDSPSNYSQRYDHDPAISNKVLQNIQTLTFGGTLNFSSRVVNDARFNQSWVSARRIYTPDNYGGAVPVPLATIPAFDGSDTGNIYVYIGIGTSPSYVLQPRTVNQRQTNFVDTLTWTLGHHTFKAGFDYRRTYDHQILPKAFEVVSYFSANSLILNQPDNLRIISYFHPINAAFKNYSSFLQDEWKPRHGLSVSLGLRWDVSPAPGDTEGYDPAALTSGDPATLKLAPAGTPLWKTRYSSLAPRVGLAWLARDVPGSQSVIRAGFGVFYDTPGSIAAVGYGSLGNSVSVALPAGTAFPLSASQLASALPSDTLVEPYVTSAAGVNPSLKMPYAMQWNFTFEQQLGSNQTLSVGYVASVGRHLLVERDTYPNSLGNTAFAPGARIELVDGSGASNYHSLQARYQRRLSRGLQALASYTWSHSIDNTSSNFSTYDLVRASSDFDIRNNFQAALTYDVPRSNHVTWLFNGWAIDFRFVAQSAAPVDIIGSEVIDPSTGTDTQYQPDVVVGQPFYIYGAGYPGGRAINYAAFTAITDGPGNFGRNVLRGFGATQLDSAIHRTFGLGEKASLQFRAEAFNILNHPIFGGIDNYLSDGLDLFGRATSTANNSLGGLNSLYQTGGPRSLQLSLRLRF